MDRKSSALVVCLSLFPAMLVGCGSIPVAKFDELRTAGVTIQSEATDTFSRVERLQQLSYVARANILTEIKADSFNVPSDVDLTPDLNYRQKKIELMVNYLSLLDVLASKSVTSDIDDASRDLASSSKSVLTAAGTTQNTAKNAAGVFATVVDAVANAAASRRQREALIDAMTKGQPGIDQLVQSLQDDSQLLQVAISQYKNNFLEHANFARARELKLGPAMAKRLGQQESEELSAMVDAFNHTVYAIRYQSDVVTSERLATIDAVSEALKQMDATIAALPTAHKETLESLTDPTKPTEALRNFNAAARKLKDFYKGLPN